MLPYSRGILKQTLFRHVSMVIRNNTTRSRHYDKQGKFMTLTSAGLTVCILFGGYKFYLKNQLVERRRSECEPVELDDNFKAPGFKLVRYKNCVLSDDMVMSGLMEDVARFQARPEDIFVASYPKSGTTWLQQVVYLMCNLDKKEEEESEDEIMEWRFPYLEHQYPGLKEIDNRPGRRFIKTHLPAHLLPQSIKDNKCKVIYIYRNPKDVAVSYYHFARMLTFANFVGTLEEFVWLFLFEKIPYSPYFPHLSNYMKRAQEDSKSCLVVCYEDMKVDPESVIRKIANFLSIDLSEDDVDRIAEETSFAAMAKNKTTNYDHWDVYGLRNPKESKFMRKGQVGDYKNHFDSKLNEDFDEWLAIKKEQMPSIQFKFSIPDNE